MKTELTIMVYGQGKLGRALTRGWREAGLGVKPRAARRGWPQRMPRVTLLVLAVRDGALAETAEQLRALPKLGFEAALHCAGALDPEVLGSLRDRGVAVGQLHPLLSVSERCSPDDLAGACALIRGDARACALAKRAARHLGMRPMTPPALDTALYHAAAALCANGSVALASAAAELMRSAGLEADLAMRLTGPLLRSVAENLQRCGLPHALTGPVRRGDVTTIEAHLDRIRAESPAQAGLYEASVRGQLPLARELGEASTKQLNDIAALVGLFAPRSDTPP